jgi:hypothetical protein
MTCEPWPKWKKETALTQLLVDGDVDGADLGPVPPHAHAHSRLPLLEHAVKGTSRRGWGGWVGGWLSLINKLQEVFILRRGEGERGRRVGTGAKEGKGGDTPNVVKADMILIPTKESFIMSCLLGVIMSVYQKRVVGGLGTLNCIEY